MMPIPETLAAIGELEPYLDDGSLLEQLIRTATLARAVAPDLVGVSVTVYEHGVTLTLVATDDETVALDDAQYLTSGPCVKAQEEEPGRADSEQDLMNEARWQHLDTARAGVGVRSTLTFPIVEAGRVVSTIDLYGGSDDTFFGKHQRLATVFGAWALGAVTNADLAFTTRSEAEKAPVLLRDQTWIETATGVVASARNVDVATALDHLKDAAQRTGIPLATLAHSLLEQRKAP